MCSVHRTVKDDSLLSVPAVRHLFSKLVWTVSSNYNINFCLCRLKGWYDKPRGFCSQQDLLAIYSWRLGRRYFHVLARCSHVEGSAIFTWFVLSLDFLHPDCSQDLQEVSPCHIWWISLWKESRVFSPFLLTQIRSLSPKNTMSLV